MRQKISFLDACVLYPYWVRDILIQFSIEGLFQAKWSDLTETELVRNLEENIPKVSGKLANLIRNMRSAVPDWSAVASPQTINEVHESATDTKDVAVLAAAIDASCEYLVTYNIRDFDVGFASARGVTVIHPDEFIYDLIQRDPAIAKKGLSAAVARLKNPSLSDSEYCVRLNRNNLHKSAAALSAL